MLRYSLSNLFATQIFSLSTQSKFISKIIEPYLHTSETATTIGRLNMYHIDRKATSLKIATNC